ncbi:hypothetical protein BDE36_2452 [Arcticibacter tournemirensis]|uniref:RNA polymerase alpha subunit C-terminal domain-containing protein n=1 Tax=Arcticibacter tournemirensis TaxID=699437 RepID=A0A5M9H0J2_9SPHI|nr:hypothetical protein [Arcticibacter tournemirensis]KAA8480090.1 hypothetical protein F1649_15850 [Arcticibacter tournemirensis]TQM50694.1 hypothetical protein BDE36_2452 [Arcticibacter tournemirensis]
MNITDNQEELLNARISHLPFSESFIYHSQNMGFTSLKEITDLGWVRLTRREGFTNMWFGELLTLLKKEGLLSLLYRQEQDIFD